MIQTDFFGIGITPEDYVTVQEVCHPYCITSALGRHQCSCKAPVYVGHHHITTVSENKLWESAWKTQIPDNSFQFMIIKTYIWKPTKIFTIFWWKKDYNINTYWLLASWSLLMCDAPETEYSLNYVMLFFYMTTRLWRRIYHVMCDCLYLKHWLCRCGHAPRCIHQHSCSGVSQDGLHTAGHKCPRSHSHYSLDNRTSSLLEKKSMKFVTTTDKIRETIGFKLYITIKIWDNLEVKKISLYRIWYSVMYTCDWKQQHGYRTFNNVWTS